MDEQWRDIKDFPGYIVSCRGRIYSNRTGTMLSFSKNQSGVVKVNLMRNHEIHTRAVRNIVARSFLPAEYWDGDSTAINLNGDLEDNRIENLAVRPRWFALMYVRQFHTQPPIEYHVRVLDNMTDVCYPNVMAVGKEKGELWEYIYGSILYGRPVYPSGSVYSFG